MKSLVFNNLKCVLTKSTIRIYTLFSIIFNLINIIFLFIFMELANTSTGFDYSLLSPSEFILKGHGNMFIIYFVFIIFLIRFLCISYSEISNMDDFNCSRVSKKVNYFAKFITIFILSLLVITVTVGIHLFFLEIYAANQNININFGVNSSIGYYQYYGLYPECKYLLTSPWIYSLIHFVCLSITISSVSMIGVAIYKRIKRFLPAAIISIIIVIFLYIFLIFLGIPNLSSLERLLFISGSSYDIDTFYNIILNTCINAIIYILISLFIDINEDDK